MQKKSFRVSERIMATHGQRFAHYILDLVFEYIFIFIVFLGLAIIGNFLQSTAILEWMASMNQIEGILIMIVAILIYTNLTEIFFSRTLAKFFTGTIVVMEDGSRPNTDTIMIRSICRLIPFDHFSFLGTPSRGWHDSLSHTYVVNKKMLEEELRQYYKTPDQEESLNMIIDSSEEPGQTA